MTAARRRLGLICIGGIAMSPVTMGAESAPAESRASGFAQALISAGPSVELGDAASTYDWLIGVWDVDVIDFLEDGSRREQRGEWHFSWTLEGRAVQDVFVVPSRSERTEGSPRPGNRYGTSIRIYDRSQNLWRVTWINPVTGAHDELTGRKVGGEVAQEGQRSSGQRIRWVFTDITADACLWYGEALQADGRTWKREVEFHLRKKTADSVVAEL